MKQKKAAVEMCCSIIVIIIVMLAFFKCKSSNTEGYDWSDASSNLSSTNKSIWIADEKMYQGKLDSNGLAVILQVVYRSHNGEPPPLICDVCIVNASTNLFQWCWKGGGTNLMSIELLNSDGKAVEKTDKGLKYGKFLTEQQYDDFFQNGKRPAFLRGYAFIPYHTGTGYELYGFVIPELFKITEPGEYTLRVQVQMGQMDFPEKKLKRIIMPPAVTAKIQIRANGNFLTNSDLIVQTNTFKN